MNLSTRGLMDCSRKAFLDLLTWRCLRSYGAAACKSIFDDGSLHADRAELPWPSASIGGFLVNKRRFESLGNDIATRPNDSLLEFSSVVQNHRPQIFRFLLASLRDMELAEMLTQECFLKAYRKWSTFRGDSSARTWLMRIAINLQKDHWRSQRVRFWRQACTDSVDIDMACDWLPSTESSPDGRVMARESVRRAWKAVQRMSERRRTVFLLRFVADLNLSEISRVTGRCESTTKAHLYRALKIVRAELGMDT